MGLVEGIVEGLVEGIVEGLLAVCEELSFCSAIYSYA